MAARVRPLMSPDTVQCGQVSGTASDQAPEEKFTLYSPVPSRSTEAIQSSGRSVDTKQGLVVQLPVSLFQTRADRVTWSPGASGSQVSPWQITSKRPSASAPLSGRRISTLRSAVPGME